jgi:hypothetical protein
MKDQSAAAEIEFVLPCQDCGCHAVFMASTPLGKRSNASSPLCCQCGVRRGLRDAALSTHGNRISYAATAGQAVPAEGVAVAMVAPAEV